MTGQREARLEGVERRVGMAAKWGGVPFYLFVLLQGMPLGRELTPMRSRYSQEAQQQLVDRVTTVGVTQSILPALVWSSIYLLAFLLLTRKSSRQLVAEVLRKQWPLIALVVFGFLSMFWSPNIAKVAASSFHAVGVTIVALAAAIRCASNPRSFLTVVAACLAANLLVHFVAVVAAPDIGVAIDGRWMGMATHSNTLGGTAMLGVWAATAAVIMSTGTRRKFLLIPLAISCVVLIGSGSMTSIMSALLSVFIALYIRLSRAWPRDLRLLANVAVVCAVVALAVAMMEFDALIASVTSDLGKTSDFTGRGVIWQEAWRLILEHPLAGWGFDDNARVIVETRFVHTSYHNGYLDLAVRGGAIALLLVAVGFVLFGKAYPRAELLWRMSCLSLVAAFLLHNLMEVSLFAPRSAIWVAFLAVIFCTVLVVAGTDRSMRAGDRPPEGLL